MGSILEVRRDLHTDDAKHWHLVNSLKNVKECQKYTVNSA